MFKYLFLMASAFEPDDSYYNEYEIDKLNEKSFFSPSRKL